MRTLKKSALTLLMLALVAALGVLGTVWALNTFTSSGPLAARCTADVADLGKQTLAPDQADNAGLITAIALQRGLPARAATIGIATAMQESKMRNIDYGDRDSLGMFQQRPSQGWGTEEQVQDPRYATEAFYDVLARIEGYDDMPVTVAAQAVQRSAFPDAYAQHEELARAFASALTGHAPAAVNCRLREADSFDVSGFSARLAADFPDAKFETHENTVEITPPSDSEGGTRQLWALANWSVVVADSFGVESVSADQMTWTRNEPWQDAPSDASAIIVTFSTKD